MGFSAADLHEMGIRRLPQDLEIWPEHHQAWDAWMALQASWQVVVNFIFDGVQLVSQREYLGIDRSQAESTMRMMGIKRRQQRKVLDHLLAMEYAARPILNSG